MENRLLEQLESWFAGFAGAENAALALPVLFIAGLLVLLCVVWLVKSTKITKESEPKTAESIKQDVEAVGPTELGEPSIQEPLQRQEPQLADLEIDVPQIEKPLSDELPTFEEVGPKETIKDRLRRGVSRTGSSFGNLFLGKPAIDDDLLEELETLLLMADVGIEITTEIIDSLTNSLNRKDLADSDVLRQKLQGLLLEMIKPCEQPLKLAADGKPKVLLVVGVNGVGKTTTIGKMTKRFQAEGKSVMLAAGDTFRAAAVEQLQTWGERNNVQVVAQHTGADSASVIFDAVQSAQAKGVDIVIADTAGRLHNKSNLMDELTKVTRVMSKLDETAPHEVLLVLDAGTGQNALSQMQEFQKAVGVTGIALTKLDGTAKGGVIFPLCKKFDVPVRFIGVGESAEDLQTFVASDFVDALFENPEA